MAERKAPGGAHEPATLLREDLGYGHQEFPAQKGMRRGSYSLWGLRRALRRGGKRCLCDPEVKIVDEHGWPH